MLPRKIPSAHCRPVSAQFMADGVIAMFELREEEDGVPRVAEERHYNLVPFDKIEGSDLDRYRLR